MYEWIDPWKEIERAEHIERAWYDRENEHRDQMGAAARAFADATYQIRRQAEAIIEPYLKANALLNHPINSMLCKDVLK